MEKIRKLNLEVALFVKELNSYNGNVDTEINDETIKLLIESVESTNKLQKISKFQDRVSSNESGFINSLNDDIFKCRRYIVCCLCHEQFPLTSEDFAIHKSKRGHKEKEIELQSLHSIEPVGNLAQTNPSTLVTPENLSNKSNSSDSIVDNDTTSYDESVTKSIEIPKRESNAENLANAISSEAISISRNIGTKAIDLIFRSVQRISLEVQILDLLSRHLKGFDSTVRVVPFGSATYGFGGSSTDFNILVVTETGVFNEKFIKTSGLQTDFQLLDTILGDRVQNRRLQAVHKSSDILCRIHFDLNFEPTKSSQIIRNCILHSPLCYYLIAYIKSWQNALNDAAAKRGLCAFQFNTYIISVLVIFFLQLNKQFPRISDVPATERKFIDYVPDLGKEKFKRTAVEFFKFYSNQYQIKNHVISVNIGRWKNRVIDNQQSNLTPEEGRLKAGIESNAANWENCTMYVQDLVSPGINIAAEISEDEANNFKNMCKVFASSELCDQSIDEYLTKISEERSTYIKITLGNNVDSTQKPSSELCKTQVSIPKCSAAATNLILPAKSSPNSNLTSTSVDLKPAAMKKLEDVIEVDTITKHAKIEMDEILTPTSRAKKEQDIVDLLTFFMATFVPSIKFTPFGSTTYGFGGTSTNFNILASSATMTPGGFKILLENLLKASNEFKNEFESLKRVDADRVILRLRKSGILCTLQFATKGEILHVEQTKKLILDYLNLHPLCKRLIACVAAWQNILNKEALKHGLVAFNMNFYTIAVLVIFYLQMNHKLPKVKDLPSVITNKPKFSIKSDLNQLKKGFFEFYGKSFNCNTHIISIHVGKWQQKIQDKQKHLTDEQKSMRVGIKTCPKNWMTSTMWVQDIILPRVNITAEISGQEVDNFVRMCQIFAKHKLNTDGGSQRVTQTTLKTNSSQSVIPLLPTFDSINTNLVKLLEKEVRKFCLPSNIQQRQHFESEIFSTMQSFLHQFDASLKLYAFGSSQYGIRLPGSNYNLMIVSTSQIRTLQIATQLFLSKFGQSSVSCNFNTLHQISANRVMSSQISMTHRKSGINCIITFETDQTIIESTKIIARFTKNPLCNILISLVRLLLDVLQRSNILNFEFNTYTISILVIFFLQVEHKFPTVEQIVSQGHGMPSNVPKFEQAMKDFFKFYGQRYQIKEHVISANVGQWQERRTQPKQKLSSGDAKGRLHAGIASSPENWKNCTMFVQDLVRLNVNATADISKTSVENFKTMCELFANGKF